MAEHNQEWSWVAEDGTEHAVDESELTFALSSEELPPHILVHKSGWGQWLPAMQVAELQWALPAGRSDNARTPESGDKPAPPLAQYPGVKKRARDIARGKIDPASESALSLPNIRAQKATDSQPLAAEALRARHPLFSEAESDEPTLQIDPEALDYAFERIRTAPESAQPSPSPPSAARNPKPSSPPPAAPRPAGAKQNGGPRLALSLLSSRPPAPSSDDLGEREVPSPAPAPVEANATPAPANAPTPAPGAPASQAVSPPHTVPPPFGAPPASRPTLDSRSSFPPPALASRPPAALSQPPPPFPSSLPPQLQQSRKWPWVVTVLLGVGAAGAAYALLGSDPPPAPAPAPIVTAKPEPPKVEPKIPACEITTTPVAIAGWALPSVKPIFHAAPGEHQLALGYAQTSKLSVGLVIDPKTLGADKRFSNHQNSPLLSVAPVTSAMGQQLEFLESRAASTLQSAVFVPAKRPYAFGLSSGGLAVRHDLQQGDVVIHKREWETINVPTVVQLGSDLFGVILRAGGERGDLLQLTLDGSGKLENKPFALEHKAYKIGLPAAAVTDDEVLVTFAGISRDSTTKSIYVASAKAPELPQKATLVRSTKEGMESPGIVGLDGGYLLQYTEGELGKQRVVAQILDADLRPQEDIISISPEGKDAYDGTLAKAGPHLVVAYLVRNGTNNELWATTLGCKTPE